MNESKQQTDMSRWMETLLSRNVVAVCYVPFRFDGGLFNSIQADRNLYKSNESINPIGSISVNEDERRKRVSISYLAVSGLLLLLL